MDPPKQKKPTKRALSTAAASGEEAPKRRKPAGEASSSSEKKGGKKPPKPATPDPSLVNQDHANAETEFVALCEAHPQGLQEKIVVEKLSHIPVETRAAVINTLLQRGRLQLGTQGSSIVYQLLGHDDAQKFRGLGPAQMLVYQIIKKEHDLGIWIKNIRQRSNLNPNELRAVLKVLTARNLIKLVKSGQTANKKVFMLSELEPRTEGNQSNLYGVNGPDLEAIANLEKVVRMCLAKKPSGMTAAVITTFIKQANISRVALNDNDITTILEAMCLEGTVEIISDSEGEEGEAVYRLLKRGLYNYSTNIPCLSCPVVSRCTSGGMISPQTCPYLPTWFNGDDAPVAPPSASPSAAKAPTANTSKSAPPTPAPAPRALTDLEDLY